MNTLMLIAVIAVGLLVLTGFVMAVTNDSPTTKATETKQGSCCSGNSCTAENNCGKATCGAVSGGGCGCGK